MSGFNRTASIHYYAVEARAHCGPGPGAALDFVIHPVLATWGPVLVKECPPDSSLPLAHQTSYLLPAECPAVSQPDTHKGLEQETTATSGAQGRTVPIR